MATYYVSQVDGDDTNHNGLYPTDEGGSNGPWLTLAKIEALTGDKSGNQYLLHKAGTWREDCHFQIYGTTGNPVVFGAYGTGSGPKIYGSDALTSWSYHDTGIWSCSYTGTITMLFFINASDGKTKWGNSVASHELCVAEYDWYSDGSTVYCYTGGSSGAYDPDARYTSIEASVRTHLFWNSGARSYITFQDIELAYSTMETISQGTYGQTNWIIDNCTVHHCGTVNGGNSRLIYLQSANCQIKNCLLYEGGKAAIRIACTAGSGTISGIIIENNVAYNCYHALIDFINDAGSGGLISAPIIRYNFCYTDDDYAFPALTCHGIYLQGHETGPVYTDGAKVYYNVVVNMAGSGIMVNKYTTDTEIYNNTVYGSNPNALENSAFGICTGGIGGVSGTIIKNNVALNARDYCLVATSINDISECDYNCWYHTSEGTQKIAGVGDIGGGPWHYNDFAAFKTATGWETHGFWEDPHFVNAGGDTAEDYKLASDSPLIDQGVDVSLPEDYWGTSIPQGSAPDIGAHEYMELLTKIRFIKTSIS